MRASELCTAYGWTQDSLHVFVEAATEVFAARNRIRRRQEQLVTANASDPAEPSSAGSKEMREW
jgi:hypothetical protein